MFPAAWYANLHTVHTAWLGLTSFFFRDFGRLLMLSGAELILVPLSLTLAHLSPSEPLGATNLQRLCQTRAFENVAAVACVVPGSASATQFASRLELLGSTSHSANGSAATVWTAAVPLDMLRQTRRGRSIWGDAYRRPYDYRELCGFAPTLPPPALEPPSIVFTDDQRRHDQSRASNAEHLVVGIMQMMASNESLAGNLAKAEAYAREAKQQGADVVLMPELWSSGYAAFFPPGDPAGRNDSAYFEWMDSATPLDGDFVRHFQRLAIELNMAIGTSYLERNEGGATPPRNSIAMIDRHGRVLYNYQKVHICSFVSDEAMTSAGRHFHTAALDVGKPAIGEVAIGSMICFDRENPESARLLALHGAEVLLVPNACGVGKQLLDQFAVRALENGVNTVMANHVSYHGEPPFAMNGNSPAYSFDGSTVHAPVEGEEGVFLARFNMTALRAYRASPLGAALRQIKPRPGLCNLQQTAAFEGARGALARFNTPL
jgi:N-carbamoylputrescine amidase